MGSNPVGNAREQCQNFLNKGSGFLCGDKQAIERIMEEIEPVKQSELDNIAKGVIAVRKVSDKSEDRSSI